MDIWDWIKSLQRWWWIIVLFPVMAAGIGWIAAPEPEYESQWTVNIVFDDPDRANSPAYFDFILLDDFALLMRTGALGDVIYLSLPEDVRAELSREDFGAMITSSRKAHFVEITVSGDDPELILVVAETINANAEEVANQYLVPPTVRDTAATLNTLDPIPEPTLNTQPRMVLVGSVTMGTLLVSIAATGVVEWLRLSYRAKYDAR